MQKLIFKNGNGVTVDLTDGDFGITEWNGLSENNLNIQTQQVPFQDGSVFIDALLEDRELSFTLAINDDGDLEKRYRLKRELISLFNPKLGEGIITYSNDFISKQIQAVPQLPIFPTKNINDSGTLKASLTFHCCSPYWEDIEETEVELLSNDMIEVENEGDVNADVEIVIETSSDAPLVNPRILNRRFEPILSYNGTINNGSLIISTKFGNKTARLAFRDNSQLINLDNSNYRIINFVFWKGFYFFVNYRGGGSKYEGNVLIYDSTLTVKIKTIEFLNDNPVRFVYSNDVFILICDKSYYYSYDGFHFNKCKNIGSAFDSPNIGSVNLPSNNFYSFSEYESLLKMWYSEDGVTWNYQLLPTNIYHQNIYFTTDTRYINLFCYNNLDGYIYGLGATSRSSPNKYKLSLIKINPADKTESVIFTDKTLPDTTLSMAVVNVVYYNEKLYFNIVDSNSIYEINLNNFEITNVKSFYDLQHSGIAVSHMKEIDGYFYVLLKDGTVYKSQDFVNFNKIYSKNELIFDSYNSDFQINNDDIMMSVSNPGGIVYKNKLGYENVISDIEGNMNFSLDVGKNSMLFDDEQNSGTCKIKFKNKYLGV